MRLAVFIVLLCVVPVTCSVSSRKNGICLSGNGWHACSCDPGYVSKAQCEKIIGCSAKPCVHGNCTDVVTGYKCSCPKFYLGTNCQNANLASDYSKVSQSSLHSTGYAKLAVDGNDDPNWSGNSCTHTRISEESPKWTLVLQKPVSVKRLVITNREGYTSRLSNLAIHVDGKLCAMFHGPPDADADINVKISCGSVLTGQTITIQKTKGKILTLCEVKIYAR